MLRVVQRLRRWLRRSDDEQLAIPEIASDEQIARIIEDALHGAQRDTAEQLWRDAPKLLRAKRRERRRFEQRLMWTCRRAFDLYDLCFLVAHQIGKTVNREGVGEAQQANDVVFYVLVRLHARACLVASEVRALLAFGHAAGAHARWRTLHEIAVIASFIRENGRDTAQRYLDHDVIQRAKEAIVYERYCERLAIERLEGDIVADLQSAAKRLTDKYGESFSLPYGWAAHALKPGNTKHRPKFDDIEESTQLDHMRPYYKMASHGVHAEPRFIDFMLGNKRSDDLLLSGRSNVGLTDPAHGALISLVQCTATLNAHSPTIDTAILGPMLLELSDRAGDAFLAVEKQIGREEKELHAAREKNRADQRPDTST